MEGSFETTNEVIVDWIETKLRDACRCVGLFMNYILIPRDGFIKHSHPTLLLPIVKYVIEEIFNCSIVSSKSSVEPFPEEFSVKCRKYLRDHIFTPDVIIGTEVIEYLWKYISLGVASLTENINVEKEVENVKSKRKIDQLDRKREILKNFKKEMAGGNKEELANLATRKFRSYKELKDKISNAIKSSNTFIAKYEDAKNQFKTYSAILKLSSEEEDLLSEMGVKSKKIKRMREYKDYENEQNKLLQKKEISEEDYADIIISLLKSYLGVLDRITQAINTSKISKILIGMSPEMWEKEYVKFEEKTHVTKFLSSVEQTLSEKIKEIEDADDIKEMVEKKLSKVIKNRIGSFQTYISQKKCVTEVFDNEIDGCIIESLIYLLVTLTDWLEVNYITSMEINYVLRILLPAELSSYIVKSDNEWSKEEDSNELKFKMLLTKRIQKYNLKFKKDAFDDTSVIYKTLKSIDKLDHDSEKYKKFNNRVRYFANNL